MRLTWKEWEDHFSGNAPSGVRSFIVLSRDARAQQGKICSHKRCARGQFVEDWYEYMYGITKRFKNYGMS